MERRVYDSNKYINTYLKKIKIVSKIKFEKKKSKKKIKKSSN